MKKLLALTLCLALLLALVACGGKTEPDTPSAPPATALPAAPTPDPTPAPAPTEPPVSYPILVPVGQEIAADLNGDGAEETLCVSLETDAYGGLRAHLTVNGTDMTGAMNEAAGSIDCPDPDYYAVADIDASDDLLELAIQDWGPSSDYCTHFLRWDGSGLSGLGAVEGMIRNTGTQQADLIFDGKGTVSSYQRLAVLQTWWADVDWRIGETGVFAPVPQDVYTAKHLTPVTVTADILGYAAPDAGSASRTLAAGTTLTVTGTDNASWVRCTLEEGKETHEELWLRLTGESDYKYELETPAGGTIPCWDALDGLLMAD